MEISSNIEDRALDIKNDDCQKLGCQYMPISKIVESNLKHGVWYREKKK